MHNDYPENFEKYPPGSNVAIENGCACPVLDNCRGKGAYSIDGKTQYWVNGDCELHG